tara:strand:- start:702 stop:1037 length:336 start_codon:yes stop_codon:yes gene_type:complete
MPELKYPVVCGATGKTLTDGADQARIHTYSTKTNSARTYWLQLDKNAPEVAVLLKTIQEATAQLWSLNNQSPTSFVAKQQAEAKVDEVAEDIAMELVNAGDVPADDEVIDF